MAQSSIEWTEMTWNPVTGCNKLTAGCKFCYAEVMSHRLKAMGVEKYANGFSLTIHEDELLKPYLWKKPKIVFVNSMSDLFHKEVPLDFIRRVFSVMEDNPQHIFQVLTKRADLLLQYDKAKELQWAPNIWMGVSVENAEVMHRVEDLTNTKAKVKFISAEPLLGPLPSLNLKNIDWVIVGGESGRKPRPMELNWVLDIQKECNNSKAEFFFKQWGGTNKKKAGRVLNGKVWNGMPKAIVEC
jgi:protein gp37